MTRTIRCVLLLVALVLTGCRLEGQVVVAVDANGGGALDVTLAADERLRHAAADAGADPLQALERAGGRLPGWDVRRHGEAGDDQAVTLSTQFRDPAELARVTTDLAAGLAGPELAPLGPMRLAVSDDTLTLTGTADLRVSEAVSELGLTRRQARRRLAEGLRFSVTVRMPGEILDANADDRPDDRTAVWNITPGQRRSLDVSAARPWSPERILALLATGRGLAVLASIALALAVLALLWLRRRRPDASTADEPEPAEGRDAAGAAHGDAVAVDGVDDAPVADGDEDARAVDGDEDARAVDGDEDARVPDAD